MYRASDLLKKTRQDRYLTIDQVASALKIPKKYLKAIESDQIKKLPSEPYCSLIVKTYAEHLKLDGNNVLRLFRRDFAQKDNRKSNKKLSFSLTPQLVFSLATIFAILLFSLFLLSEYFKYNQPPQLQVNWPENTPALGTTLVIDGKTDSQANITVNDSLVIVDEQGRFKKEINIKALPTTIVVQAQSSNGKTTTKQRQYQP